MANFDPQVQPEGDNPFIYGFGARPIQQPKTDTSGEVLGKTIGHSIGEAGDLLAEGARSAYETASTKIKEDLHNQYDPIQNNYINRLAQVDDVLKRPGNENILQLASNNYPSDVQKIPVAVDQLIALRDSGKVSQTYLDMQRDAIAKQARAAHPGMRDVIDNEFSRMTREDPANKVMQSLTEDINAYASAAREAKDKVSNVILSGVKEGIVPPAAYYQYQQDPSKGPQIMQAIYQHGKVENDLKISDLQITNALKRHELTKVTVAENTTDYVGKQVALGMSNLQITIPGLSPMGINDLLTKVNSGEVKLNEQQALQLEQMVAAQKTSVLNGIRQAGYKSIDPNDPRSPSRAAMMGGDEFEKLVENAGKQFDAINGYLGAEKYGPANFQAEWNRGAIDEETGKAIKNIPGLAALAGIEKLAGPNSTYTSKFFEQFITNPTIDKAMTPYVSGVVATMAAQPNLQATGINFTLSNALDDATKKDLNTPKYSGANQAIISGVLWAMTNPDSPWQVKKNAATAVYSDPDLTTRFNPSTVTPQGQVTPGRSTVVAQTINTKTTQEVKKISDPDVTQNYIDYTKKSVGNTIWPEISTLNEIQSDPNVHIQWNTQDHQFTVRLGYEPGEGKTVSHTFGQLQQVQDAVKKINMAMRSLIDVNSKMIHGDVDEFLMQFFVENGMDPRLVTDTIGGKFLEALKNSHKEVPGVAGGQ